MKESFQLETTKIESFTRRVEKSGPTEVSDVPLVVYRSWHSDQIPVRMMETVKKTIAMTPEFDNYFFTDQDCIEFIESNYEPNVGKAFRCLKAGAYKSDLWRYCILYKRGGIYIDIKLELHLRLKEILEKYPKLFIIDMAKCDDTTALWNGVMSSPPGNPMFKACIDEIVENCRNRDYKSNDLDITACCLLGRMMDKYEGKEFTPSLPFKHQVLRKFHYNDDLIFSEYDGYREDQAANQITERYGKLWKERNVFNMDITFD
jgi:mannosyltransferase OCH1-like enzyme